MDDQILNHDGSEPESGPNEGPEDISLPFIRSIYLLGTEVAGTAYVPDISKLYASLREGDTVNLIREPANKYDAYAIRVDVTDKDTAKPVPSKNADPKEDRKLGYIPRGTNRVLARLMDAGKFLYGIVRHKELIGEYHRIIIRAYMIETSSEGPIGRAAKTPAGRKEAHGKGKNTMIESNYDILDGIRNTLARLDVEEAPQSRGFLEDILISEGEKESDPYTIAHVLLECDKPEPIPEPVRDLIEELFVAACLNGNPDAMNDLGAQYYDGSRGFEQDFTKSVNCYKLAAQYGSRQAQENLGYCYYYGRNVPVDYEKAFHYFALGAFDGHLISLYKIADMYANGYYVEKNPVEAFHIYTHCIDRMSDQAAERVAGPVYLRIGNAFLNGLGTEENAKNALVCFQKAESFLYDMVANGEAMYKKSLEAAIEGQAKARIKLREELPGDEWEFD